MSDSESDSDNENVVKERTPSRHRSQKFRDCWMKMPQLQNWLRPVKENKFKAKCALCQHEMVAELSILKKHSNSAKHKEKEKNKSSNKPISKFLVKQAPTSSQTDHAEIQLCGFIAEHNISFLTMDHLTPLLKNIFPDSAIAKDLTLRRTKSKAVVTNVIGATHKENLAQDLKMNKFSILIDESTDISTTKHVCIVVRHYSCKLKKVQTSFWELVPLYQGESSVGNAEHLFNITIETFTKWNIPPENIIGFASDGCNLMMGSVNSVSSRFKLACPGIIIIKCICHSLHLCSSQACKSLPRTCEDLARNIYNFFKTSSKRQHDFKQFQVFAEVEVHKILHPSQTRWLSLTCVVSRILEQWNALQLFFNEKFLDERLLSAEQIHQGLNDPFNKLYFLFLNFVLPKITKINQYFQSEKVIITNLHSVMTEAFQDLLLCFMQRSFVLHKQVFEIDPEDKSHFLGKTSLYLGIDVYNEIQKPAIQSRQDLLNHFYDRCLKFLSILCKEITKRYNFNDDLLSNIHIFKPENAMKNSIRISHPTLAPFLTKLNRFYSGGTQQAQAIDDGWRLLPNFVFSSSDNLQIHTIDLFWVNLKNFKNDVGEPVFVNLSNFVINILSLPHSNASCERIFSKINNIKSKSRNKLITTTINGCLLAAECVAEQANCTKFIPCQKMLSKMTSTNLYGDDGKGEDNEEDSFIME